MIAASLFAAVLLAAPADITGDFEAANERALAGEAEQAEALYTSILERGYEDSDVYYNLGHTLEDQGRLVDAIVAYERALWRDPGDAEARQSVDRLRARVAPEAPARDADAVGFADAFGPWIRGLPMGLIGWTAAALFFVGCLLRVLGRPRPAWGVLVCAGLGLGAVALGAAVAADRAAVVVDGVPLREGPDPRFAERARVLRGERVRWIGRDAGFIEVQRADGTTGYVERGALEQL